MQVLILNKFVNVLLSIYLSLGYQKVRDTWQLYKEEIERIETNLMTEDSKPKKGGKWAMDKASKVPFKTNLSKEYN